MQGTPHKFLIYRNLSLTPTPNQQYIDLVPSRYEGRFAIVTSAGWDAVDADALLTNGADAYGEVVWSWRRDAGAKSGGAMPPGDGDNKARSPGRARYKS